MKIGFTGTQEGMSDRQKGELRTILSIITTWGVVEFHHGDCIGADAEADAIARSVGCRIFIHPPSDPKKRAYCGQTGDVQYAPEPYLDRNRNIVDNTERLIAAPRSDTEEVRSGTWSTVRYARRVGKPVEVLER